MNRTHLGLFVSAICVGMFLSTSTPTARADALDNWTTNQVSTNWFGLGHVVYGNGRYVAAGSWSSYGAYLSSEDGLNWTLRVQGDTNGAGNVYSLVFSEGRFMTTGGPLGARTGISTNGIDWLFGWVQVEAHLRAMAYGAGKYVVVVDAFNGNRKNVFTSTNGTDWAGPLFVPTTARDYKDIAYGAGVFVAVTGDGYVHVSSGGTTFSRFPEFAGTGSSISYCKNLFISPSSSGTNALSSDGYFWTTAYTGIAGEMGRVKFENGVFFARTANHLVTSTDGTNWVQQTASALPGTGEIAFDGTRFVNVGRRYASSSLEFDSFIYASAPLVALELAWEASAQLRLSGLVGHPHRIEYLPSLPASATNPWQTLTNLILPSSPYFIADPESPSAAQRYYRAVLLP